MSLNGKRVLVFGASGNVGYGAAKAFLAAGATVVAPTRNEQSAARLVDDFAGEDLAPVIGDVSAPHQAEALRDAVRAHGEIEHVFASLGPWWQGGRTAEQSPATWSEVRGMLLDGHVHAAMLFLPLLAEHPGSSYTIVTGMGAHVVIPGTSLLHVATNGVLGLSKVLRDEHADGPIRVNELLISCRIERKPREGVIPSAVFGEAAVAIAQADRRSAVLRYDDPAQFARAL